MIIGIDEKGNPCPASNKLVDIVHFCLNYQAIYETLRQQKPMSRPQNHKR